MAWRIGCDVKGEMGRIWKKVLIRQWGCYFSIYMKGVRKTMQTFNDTWCCCPYCNWISLECKALPLPLQ
jgi:hypothetical protein